MVIGFTSIGRNNHENVYMQMTFKRIEDIVNLCHKDDVDLHGHRLLVDTSQNQGHGRFESVGPYGGIADVGRVPVHFLARGREVEVAQ